jgi:hypothetical protein
MPVDTWLEKLRSIGHLKGGRTMDRKTSGRAHPDSGLPYQAVTDELGNTVTEHGAAGTGLSARQDVEIRPGPVTLDTDATLKAG